MEQASGGRGVPAAALPALFDGRERKEGGNGVEEQAWDQGSRQLTGGQSRSEQRGRDREKDDVKFVGSTEDRLRTVCVSLDELAPTGARQRPGKARSKDFGEADRGVESGGEEDGIALIGADQRKDKNPVPQRHAMSIETVKRGEFGLDDRVGEQGMDIVRRRAFDEPLSRGDDRGR
jgi:hypothetical protein